MVGWGGAAQDVAVPADYDGDGKADLAVYRRRGVVYYPVLGWRGDIRELGRVNRGGYTGASRL